MPPDGRDWLATTRESRKRANNEGHALEPCVNVQSTLPLEGVSIGLLDYMLNMNTSSRSSSATRDLGEQHGGHSPRTSPCCINVHSSR